MTNSLMRAFVAGLVFSGFSGAAVAADPGYCNQYASAAIEAAGQNLSHHCGYYGPRWAADYQVHYGWCLGQPIPVLANEWHARRVEIEQCFNR